MPVQIGSWAGFGKGTHGPCCSETKEVKLAAGKGME